MCCVSDGCRGSCACGGCCGPGSNPVAVLMYRGRLGSPRLLSYIHTCLPVDLCGAGCRAAFEQGAEAPPIRPRTIQGARLPDPCGYRRRVTRSRHPDRYRARAASGCNVAIRSDAPVTQIKYVPDDAIWSIRSMCCVTCVFPALHEASLLPSRIQTVSTPAILGSNRLSMLMQSISAIFWVPASDRRLVSTLGRLYVITQNRLLQG